MMGQGVPFHKSAGDIKLGRVPDTPEYWSAIQSDRPRQAGIRYKQELREVQQMEI